MEWPSAALVRHLKYVILDEKYNRSNGLRCKSEVCPCCASCGNVLGGHNSSPYEKPAELRRHFVCSTDRSSSIYSTKRIVLHDGIGPQAHSSTNSIQVPLFVSSEAAVRTSLATSQAPGCLPRPASSYSYSVHGAVGASSTTVY